MKKTYVRWEQMQHQFHNLLWEHEARSWPHSWQWPEKYESGNPLSRRDHGTFFLCRRWSLQTCAKAQLPTDDPPAQENRSSGTQKRTVKQTRQNRGITWRPKTYRKFCCGVMVTSDRTVSKNLRPVKRKICSISPFLRTFEICWLVPFPCSLPPT